VSRNELVIYKYTEKTRKKTIPISEMTVTIFKTKPQAYISANKSSHSLINYPIFGIVTKDEPAPMLLNKSNQ
jgi:hypothetical protein